MDPLGKIAGNPCEGIKGLYEGATRSEKIWTNSLGRPRAAASLGGTFSTVKNAAGLRDLHFHDLRGTAATRFYTAGLNLRVIAEIMGWDEEHVAEIIKRYARR